MNNITACGKTDTGLRRKRNEDSYLIEPLHGLFVVADGMGGHAGGDRASSMAIETVRDFIKKGLMDNKITWPFVVDNSLPREINIISSGMRLANKLIFNESNGMGTTMVTLLIRDDNAYICHVGDSRLYRIRSSAIEQITEDHSLVAEEVRRGILTKEQAKDYSLRHVITKAIGTTSDIECDCKVEKILTEDIFLLCSDGLSGMLDDPEILKIILAQKSGLLGDSPGARNAELLADCCERLIKRANEKGGDDNITAILVRYT